MKKISVIGDGGWGTALAVGLAQAGHAVRVWGPFPDYLDEIRRIGENTKFLPGVKLPKEIAWIADRAEALRDAEVVVLAVPSKFFRDVLRSFASLILPQALVVSVTKGLDRETGRRMTQVAEELLGHAPIAALSGPSHAEEVARGVPTAVTIACADHAKAVALQKVFSHATFRVYTSSDVAGVELGGALKNVIAIAAGVCDGIGYGDNTKAALMTRGLAEITRLGVALGAQPDTFAGLSGMGDLVVTCTSRHSRNRMVGERLGRGESIQQILDSMAQVAEGVWTCTTARTVAVQHALRAPITEEVCAVINEGKDPRQAVQALLMRELRPERG
ncbi:MAG: NAD(P)-dependent glycerol-3-phosphate dehydrogenase [Verrucomicrobia bacterium]|nr:MAG: NAD(P)-dependent glycerol-3-phosphate dehydrogenase [Verrucomicrobiota bacterium]